MMTSPLETWSLHGTRRRTVPRARLAVEGLEARWVPSTFETIPQPIAPYLAQTSKLDITAPDFKAVASLSDGAETASFSQAGQALTTMPGQWSSPPDSESDTPRVVFIRNFTLETTIALDAPVSTFGFELEPNRSDVFSVTARFEDGDGNVLGAITRDVSGRAGARLFAGTDLSGTGISSVVLAVDAPANGFAVAQVRYSGSNLALAGPYVTASAPTNPVQTLDHVTVTFNQPTDPATFTPDQVTLTDPDGNPVPISPDSIVPNADGTVYTISFDPQNALGQYSLAVGPGITDLNGNPMDQDFDGIPGEATDVYQAAFTVSNELVVNGGFETGDLRGWTQDSLNESTFVSSRPNPPHSGTFAVQTGSFGSLPDFFWQDLSTTPGATYHVSFWFLKNGGHETQTSLIVSWGRTSEIMGRIIHFELNSPDHDYVESTIDVVATETTTRLTFFDHNENRLGLDAIDDVSVTLVRSSPGSNPGGRAGDSTLASSLVTPAFTRVSLAAIGPATVRTDPAANPDRYFATPAKPLDPVVAFLRPVLRPVPVHPADDPLDLLGGLDGWML
jgi:hypothetical protein